MDEKDINEYLAMSDSDESDWGDLEEAKADDFLEEKKCEQKTSTKYFPKNPEAILSIKPKNEVDESNTSTSKLNDLKNFRDIQKPNSKSTFVKPLRIRVKNLLLQDDDWEDRIKDRKVYPCSRVYNLNSAKQLENENWILVGVITTIVTNKSKNDAVYCYWLLNDLENLQQSVKVFLFGQTYKEHWKLIEGSVVAILMPTLMQNEKTFQSTAYKIDNPMQISCLGHSPDFGRCEQEKNNKERCKNFVNLSVCSLCDVHIKAGYFKHTERAGFHNNLLAGRERRKRQPDNEVVGTSKKLKMDFAKSKHIPKDNSLISINALNKSGIIAKAKTWGLIDRYTADDLQNATVSSQQNASNVPLSTQDNRMVQLLQKPTTGSKNLIKHVTAKFEQHQKKLEQNSDLSFNSFLKEYSEKQATTINLELPVINNKNDDASASPIDLKAEEKRRKIMESIKAKGGLKAIEQKSKNNNIQSALDKIRQKNKLDEKENPNKKQLSSDMMKMLQQGSNNKDLVDLERENQVDKTIESFNKIEQIQTKLINTHKEKCWVFNCKQCKRFYPIWPKVCERECHIVIKEEGFKRHFECIKCKCRTKTLDNYPTTCCLKCGSNKYKKAGLIKDSRCEIEKPSIDGGNKRFINN